MTPGNGRPGTGAGGGELRDIGHPLQGRATETYPVVQRTGIRFFRRVTNGVGELFAETGRRGYFLRDITRAFADPATYVPETIRQMRRIGVDSLPLAAIVAGIYFMTMGPYWEVVFAGTHNSMAAAESGFLLAVQTGSLEAQLDANGLAAAVQVAHKATHAAAVAARPPSAPEIR